MTSLRDAASELERLGARVFGVSLDDVTSIAKFAKAQELPFRLLSDPDGSAAMKYDALMEKRPYARRRTVVIGRDGAVRALIDSVDVRRHGEDLVELIESWRKK